jgi:hypothetical protein
MDKLDYKKEMKEFYFPSIKKFSIVDVPMMKFIMTDGYGDPNKSPLFRDAMKTLYGISFTIKFMLKREKSRDYVTPPLEGLWWIDDMNEFSIRDKDRWKWTLMIRQPEWVGKEHFEKALSEITDKKGTKASVPRLENFQEGPSAQIMYIGPYDAEQETIKNLHLFIKENGHSLRGRHHEIYMSDPRKTDPLKLKTIIRQPFI